MSLNFTATWNSTAESRMRQPEASQRSLLDAPLWPGIAFPYEMAFEERAATYLYPRPGVSPACS
jgi:hypothetical protein